SSARPITIGSCRRRWRNERCVGRPGVDGKGFAMKDWRERWETVIGLEVHTHLKTASKLFSPAPVRYGEAPNHAVHAIDLALPGVLPVLNERAVELAIRL